MYLATHSARQIKTTAEETATSSPVINVSARGTETMSGCQRGTQNGVPSVQQGSGSRYSSTTSTTATSSTSGLMSMVLPSEELVSSNWTIRGEKRSFSWYSRIQMNRTGCNICSILGMTALGLVMKAPWNINLVQVQMRCVRQRPLTRNQVKGTHSSGIPACFVPDLLFFRINSVLFMLAQCCSLSVVRQHKGLKQARL